MDSKIFFFISFISAYGFTKIVMKKTKCFGPIPCKKEVIHRYGRVPSLKTPSSQNCFNDFCAHHGHCNDQFSVKTISLFSPGDLTNVSFIGHLLEKNISNLLIHRTLFVRKHGLKNDESF